VLTFVVVTATNIFHCESIEIVNHQMLCCCPTSCTEVHAWLNSQHKYPLNNESNINSEIFKLYTYHVVIWR